MRLGGCDASRLFLLAQGLGRNENEGSSGQLWSVGPATQLPSTCSSRLLQHFRQSGVGDLARSATEGSLPAARKRHLIHQRTRLSHLATWPTFAALAVRHCPEPQENADPPDLCNFYAQAAKQL